MTNTAVLITFYSGICLLIFFGIRLIVELIYRTKDVYINTLRLLLNLGTILTFCYGALINLALIVRPPSEITNSHEQSLDNLRQWIFEEVQFVIMYGLIMIIGLSFMNYLFQRKMEKPKNVKPIIQLFIINSMILLYSAFLIYHDIYDGLKNEVGYHFK